MAGDGSVRSNVEQWAVDAITAANPSPGFDLIELFTGTFHASGQPQFDELRSPQTPSVRVATWDMSEVRHTDQPGDWLCVLHCFIAVEAPVGAVARVGADDHLGLNGAIEIVAGALGGKNPNVSNDAGTRYAERSELQRVVGQGQLKGFYVVDVQFEVTIVAT